VDVGRRKVREKGWQWHWEIGNWKLVRAVWVVRQQQSNGNGALVGVAINGEECNVEKQEERWIKY
jgi:hypothetical protein